MHHEQPMLADDSLLSAKKDDGRDRLTRPDGGGSDRDRGGPQQVVEEEAIAHSPAGRVDREVQLAVATLCRPGKVVHKFLSAEGNNLARIECVQRLLWQRGGRVGSGHSDSFRGHPAPMLGGTPPKAEVRGSLRWSRGPFAIRGGRAA